MAKPIKFPGPKGIEIKGMQDRKMPVKGGKNKIAPPPADPQVTLDVKNPEAEELLTKYRDEKNQENLNALISKLVATRILIPGMIPENSKIPTPALIKTPEGEVLFPIYTSKEKLPPPEKATSPAVLNLPFMSVCEMCLKEELGISGIVLNPFSENLIFKKVLIERICEVEKLKKEGRPINSEAAQPQQIKLTEQQYYVFERRNFEFIRLPMTFFENPELFVGSIAARQGEYLDELYEDMYQQKRMYPYLPEDFSVMALSITDTLSAVRIDMPVRDLSNQTCHRVYAVYDKASNRSRYFTIEKMDDGAIMGEVTAEKQHLTHGAAPADGVELQTILDKCAEVES